MKIGKRYRNALEGYDSTQKYSLTDAVELLNKMPKPKFDETVELSIHLGVDSRQSDQMVRGIVDLPNGSGKKMRILVFTDDPEAALEAGADYAGKDDMIKKIQEGWLEFDVAISAPKAMKEVRTIARILGPRGLMPNPKSGTVSDDIGGAVKAITQGGRVEYKMDKQANIGVVVGKRSFTSEQITENINSVLDSLGQVKPQGIRGRYILSATLSGSMSPGVKLEPAEYSKY